MKEMQPFLALRTVTGGEGNWSRGKWVIICPEGAGRGR